MSCVLVTGAGGNVGTEVVAACVAGGLRVRAAARSGGLPSATSGAQIERVAFDFLDQATWNDALRGCDKLFLLRPPAISDVATTLNPFIDRAYAAGVRQIVFLSVSGAERREWVPHRKVERHLEASGQAWTLLRPGFFAQNLQDAYRRDIIEDQRLYAPAGSGLVAFLDVRDAAEVAARIFTAPGEFCGRALTLTGPQALGFAEVAQMLSAALGRSIRYQAASILRYGWHLHASRALPWAQVAVQTYLHWGLRHGDAAGVDPTVEQVLGRPATSLPGYISRSLAAWR